MQIIFAGKAHPSDIAGARLIQRIFQLAQDPEFSGRIAFVEDYDQYLAQRMVRGVDVWLNTPVPPLEASGTSGMKASMNGVANLSILDGWWIEGYNGRNGWAVNAESIEVDRVKADCGRGLPAARRKNRAAVLREAGDGIPHRFVQCNERGNQNGRSSVQHRRMAKEYVHLFYTPSFGLPHARPAARTRWGRWHAPII